MNNQSLVNTIDNYSLNGKQTTYYIKFKDPKIIKYMNDSFEIAQYLGRIHRVNFY